MNIQSLSDSAESYKGEPDSDLDTQNSLIARAQQQDPQAWTTMFRIYSPLISKWLNFQNVLRPEDLEEFRQEVFTKVARHLDSFSKHEPSDSFRGWLRQITRNVVFTASRKDGLRGVNTVNDWDWSRTQQVRFEQAGQSLFDSVSNEHPDETRLIFSQLIQWSKENLSESQFFVLQEIIICNRPPAHVAEELGQSRQWVYSNKSRILARLRKEFCGLM